jgi:PTH1 family peptidyl-tRNA hydrolase
MPSLRWLRRHGALEQAQHIKLIAGLGNPGARYAHSRHNIGFMIADRFAKGHDMKFARRRFNAEVAEGEVAGERVAVIKPQTFMNSSGEAVSKFFSFYKVAPQDLLVIYDDLDLPLGKLRLRPRGSAGGHHGMESIIARIGTTDFPRLRVGIGRPNPDADIDHVLGEFAGDEFRIIDETLERGVRAIDVWLAEGIAPAMNKYNATDERRERGAKDEKEGRRTKDERRKD